MAATHTVASTGSTLKPAINNMSIGSFGGSLSSASLPSTLSFTAQSDNRYPGLPLIAQIDPRKAERAKVIAEANSFAAINSGSDRNLVLTISSNASSTATPCPTSSPTSLHTISTTGTSIVSLPDAIQRPDARPAADVTADIKKFEQRHGEFFDHNWRKCFAAVKQECRETDPIGYPRQLAYEELLRRWQCKPLAVSRSTLPSQGASPMSGGASSARVVTRRDRLCVEPIAIRPPAHPDISGTYIQGPSSLRSYHSGTPSSLESIAELRERESKEEGAYHDYLGRKIADDVVGDHSSFSRKGSERSMSSKRTSRTDLSPEDISPPPSSEVGTVSAVVQPQNQAPWSDISGAADIQGERLKKENKFTVEQLKLVPKQLNVQLADCGFSSLHDPYASPIEESGIVTPEVPDGADPAAVSPRFRDSAPPGATTPICETPISPSSSLHEFNFGFDMPRPAEASDSRNPLSDLNFDFDLGSDMAPTSEAVQGPVLVYPASTAKVKEASYKNLEALDGIPMPKTETEPSSTVISPSTPVYTGALHDPPDTDQQSLSDRLEPSSFSNVSTTAENDLGTGRLGPTSRKKRAKLGVALNRFSSRFLSGRPRYSRPGPRRTMTLENLDHNIRKTAARLQGHTRLPACVDEHAFSGPTSRNEASFSTGTETSSSGEIDELASSMKSLSVSDADQRTSLADISATTSILPEDRHKPPNSERRGRFRRIIASGPERRRHRFGAMLRRKKPPRNDA